METGHVRHPSTLQDYGRSLLEELCLIEIHGSHDPGFVIKPPYRQETIKLPPDWAWGEFSLADTCAMLTRTDQPEET
jgi:hypothetical protein